MKLPKLLYIDQPFEGVPGGDKNRSRFIWKTLRQAFDARLALIADPSQDQAHGEAASPQMVLPARPPRSLRPSAAPSFDPAEAAKLVELIRREGVEILFGRFFTPYALLERAWLERAVRCAAMDVDMLPSRLTAFAWRSRPSFKNRWFLFEWWKLRLFERRLFRLPWLFAFSNEEERRMAAALAPSKQAASQKPAPEFCLLPNVMPELPPPPWERSEPAILFYGSLDSTANRDGARWLLEEIYPLLRDDLAAAGAKIRIAGKNPPPELKEAAARMPPERVELLGPVNSIEETIAASRFVLLPLRIASGTRTRILETAALKRAAVCTPLAAEGLAVEQAVLLGETAEQLAAHASRLLREPALARDLGERLYARCRELYREEKAAADLVRTLKRRLETTKAS